MVLATRNGFQLSGHLYGTVAPPAHRYQKTATESVDSQIYVGDPVALTSAGVVTRAHANNQAGGGVNNSQNYIGICTGIFETEDGRPLTHRTNKFAASADAFWIDVIDDPDVIWEASYGSTANQTAIGSLTGIAYDTPVTAAGISGAGLQSALAMTSANPSFRVIGVVNLQIDGANASNNDQLGRVRVVSNSHLFRTTKAH